MRNHRLLVRLASRTFLTSSWPSDKRGAEHVQDVGLCGAVERRCRALSDGVARPKLPPEARSAVRVPLPTACSTHLCLAMQVGFTVPDGDRRDDDVPEIQGQFLNTLNTNFRTRHRDLIRRQKRSNGDESKTMTLTCQSTL